MDIAFGLDTVVAGVAGVIAGALPSLLRAVWKECVSRREQNFRITMMRISTQSELLMRGMEMGYTVTSTKSSDTFKPGTHKDTQDRQG